MKKGFFHRASESFHAGRFLQESLGRSGFGIEWLADKTNTDVAALEMLFTKAEMDAELFVSIGRPMGAVFFEPLGAAVFHGTSYLVENPT